VRVDARKGLKIALLKPKQMTPKEKAKELVEKFELIERAERYEDELNLFEAKQCALICVEEILNDNPNIYDSDRLNHKYWKEVKEEIEKL